MGVRQDRRPPSVYKGELSENAQFSRQNASCPTHPELWSIAARKEIDEPLKWLDRKALPPHKNRCSVR